jgi:hypothetical protein
MTCRNEEVSRDIGLLDKVLVVAGLKVLEPAFWSELPLIGEILKATRLKFSISLTEQQGTWQPWPWGRQRRILFLQNSANPYWLWH